MEQIFDRETLLDLLVNIIPLVIILFFVVAFLLFDPFTGLSGLGRALQFGLLVVPFLALAVLTYLSAKAIAGAERNGAVYLPGQAPVEGAQPVEGAHEDGDDPGPERALDSSGADGNEAGSEPSSGGAEATDGTNAEEPADGDDETVSADEADVN